MVDAQQFLSVVPCFLPFSCPSMGPSWATVPLGVSLLPHESSTGCSHSEQPSFIRSAFFQEAIFSHFPNNIPFHFPPPFYPNLPLHLPPHGSFFECPPVSHLMFLILVSPAPSSCHSSSSTPQQRHHVLLRLVEGLRHDGLFPSFSESSGTCCDWHRVVHGLLLCRHPAAPVTKPNFLYPIQSLTN